MRASYPVGYWRQIYDLDETVASKTTTDWIDAHERERILDVGCGAGRFMVAFEKKGAFVIGVDPSLEALRLAKSRVEGEIIRGSAEYLPFVAAAFEKVLCNHVIEHLGDPLLAMGEMDRVARGDGTFVLAFPNANYILFRLRIFKQNSTHRVPLAYDFSDPRFEIVRRRVFLSVPYLGDRVFEFFRLSEIRLLHRIGYNVILLMKKAKER